MDEIASVAGTSKTVLYRHMGDKGQLYLAVAEAVHALVLREVQAGLGSSSCGPSGSPGTFGSASRAAVAAGIDAYLALVERDPEVYRFVVDRPLLAGAQSPGADPVRGLVNRVGEQVGAALAAAGLGHRQGLTWGHGVVGMVRGAADAWVMDEAPVPRHELVEYLTQLAWSGLAGTLTADGSDATTSGTDACAVEGASAALAP